MIDQQMSLDNAPWIWVPISVEHRDWPTADDGQSADIELWYPTMEINGLIND